MTEREILDLIECDANSFHLTATDALAIYVEILSDLSGQTSAGDLTTLIAIGSVLHRTARGLWAPTSTTPRPRLVLVR
jgi:hypothetical protein